MDKFVIRGGHPISGVIPISGSKNAALPIMAASILAEGVVTLENVPCIADVTDMEFLLSEMGTQVTTLGNGKYGKTLKLSTCNFKSKVVSYDIVSRMRASILILGPLLAKYRFAQVSLPGGCSIGARPVGFHLNALSKMGARIKLQKGYITATAPVRGLKGADITFPTTTVTGTENILMAATLAKGETIIRNAACEPEVSDLAEFLVNMGADIEGIGTKTLRIRGVEHLTGTAHYVLPDRIETGTYAIAAALTGGELKLKSTKLILLKSVVEFLNAAGVGVTEEHDGLIIKKLDPIKSVDIITNPYPGFPTDMQAPAMTLMCTASGTSVVTENIFDNRFMHALELNRMGADIYAHGPTAVIKGVEKLSGAPVMASDLRAGAALVLAGLAAEGETVVDRIYHVDRGYEQMEEKLRGCGADIQRES